MRELRKLYPNVEQSQILVSSDARVHGCSVHVSDVVFVDCGGQRCAGKVLLLLEVAQSAYAIVSVWQPAPAVSGGHVAEFTIGHDPVQFVLDEISTPLVWTSTASGVARVLVPLHLRR